MNKIITSSIISIFVVACASTNTTEVPIDYLDLTSDANNKLFNEYWIVEKRQEPKYPVSAARKGLSGCVDLIVGVNSDGKSGFHKVKKSYPEGIFDKHAAAVLTHWKWRVADKNDERVPALTTIQLDFIVSGSINVNEAKNQCGWSNKALLWGS